MAVNFNRRKETTKLVIHCAATRPSMDIGVREIRAWHKERGFLDIGYHLVIRRDGTVEKGRDLYQVGAHAKGFNSVSVGICLVGGVDEKMKPENNFTEAQFAKLDELVETMKLTFPDLVEIVGHNDLDKGKACPSFDAFARYNKE